MKKLKILLLITFVLAIFSCQSGTNKFDKRIIGEWGIYAQTIGGMGAFCNACPSIEFKANKTATLTLPAGDKEIYNWNLKDSQLDLTSNDTNANYFKSSEYQIEIKNEKDFMELTIVDSNNQGYLLRK